MDAARFTDQPIHVAASVTSPASRTEMAASVCTDWFATESRGAVAARQRGCTRSLYMAAARGFSAFRMRDFWLAFRRG
jgi:hypothetical protein